MIRDLDVERLRRQFNEARPFRFVAIDNFLEPGVAEEVAAAYPSFEEAAARGREFKTVNELRKLQVTDYGHFPEPVQRLADSLSDPEFRQTLSAITGIEDLLWDPDFNGGGIHQTARSGILDVHVDFNLLEKRQWYRRLNLLLYLNERWDPSWGGLLELWDRDVRERHHAFLPVINRCVIFETSEISFHGVTAVNAPEDTLRRSFACYYYTREQPAGVTGVAHSTIFRARPNEPFKKYVFMPAERLQKRIRAARGRVKDRVKSLIQPTR